MRYPLLLLFLCISSITIAQVGKEKDEGAPYAREWAKADSLIDHGLPQSAVAIIQSVYERAKATHHPVQVLKAQLYLMRAESGFKEDNDTTQIRMAEREVQSSSFPNSNLWHSIAAQLYWNYYSNHRWQVLQRTILSGKSSDDIAQWDAAQFFRVIAAHYKASLQRADELYDIRLEAFDPVIIKGENTRHLRPTLYDLLAFRALGYYENDENGLPQPANQFRIDEPTLLAPVDEFTRNSIPMVKFIKPPYPPDTLSFQLRALRLYQDILKRHLNDKEPDPLIDADLHRLKFVYDHAVFPGKKKLYARTLEQLAKKYPDNGTAAEAAYRLAELMYEEDVPIADEADGGRQRPIVHTRDLKAVKAALDAIIARFPNTEAGAHARQLMMAITEQNLSLKAEEVVQPDEPSRVLVSYKNIPRVWVRLVRLTREQDLLLKQGSEKAEPILLAAPVIKTWEVALPGTQDFEMHAAELPVDAVAAGIYAVLVSDNQEFSITKNKLSFVNFQVSPVSMITIGNRHSGYILDRKTGAPLPGATIDLYTQEYNSARQLNERKKKASATTNDAGYFTVPANSSYHSAVVRYKEYLLYTNGYLGFYEGDARPQKPENKTFFFTDRSIYRPGQTIYFKGITVKSEDGGRRANVMPGLPVTVTFYDVNNQKVKSLDLKTSEYGSFNGSFIAPQGVLTGQMHISDVFGTVDVSVEEYKRPKFYVSFDTLKTAYSLNQNVTVQGHANAYAGNVIDGATVKYRVVRETRWPYYWLYWRYGGRRSSEQELVHGSVPTDDKGAFTITFPAMPDPSIDPKSLPVFTYTVHADVTDASGETRSGEQRINAGYRGLQINAAIPEKAMPKDLDSLFVRTINLNDQFVPATVKVSIAPLQSPASLPRARLWQQPDQYIMDEAAFTSLFPLDEYKDESDYHAWKEGPQVWEKEFTSTKDGLLKVPLATFSRNGWYVISIHTTDNKNQPVDDKKYVQVWDPALPGKLASPLTVFGNAGRHEPGEVVRTHAVTGFSKAYLLQCETTIDNKTNVAWHEGNGTPLSWSRPVTEADRGGIGLQWLMVKENRVYTARETIEVPWSNKDLNVTWETHRDKLQPGAGDTWTMVVRGGKKEKVAAEMVAALYDASLNAFKPHGWNIYGLYPPIGNMIEFYTANGFGMQEGASFDHSDRIWVGGYRKTYDELIGSDGNGMAGGRVMFDKMTAARPAAANMALEGQMQKSKRPSAGLAYFTPPSIAGETMAWDVAAQGSDLPGTGDLKSIPLRKNLQETAFFYPDLKTDAEGNVRIQFTMPEALTEWQFMALAHTKDMAFGQAGGTIKTQKDLMVQPNLPRFFRQGDDMVIAAKISNLSNGALSGTAQLEIVNAQTGQPLMLSFRLSDTKTFFSVAKELSTTATWRIHVPESLYEPVLVRISALAGSFTDGEENVVPVLTNRTLVTETLPLWINGSGDKTFRFDKLLHSDSSKTLSQYGLTLEYTSNPAWYAVQALPYLMEYPYECAEQTFNRYYANAQAAHILDKAPRLKEVFRTWQTTDTAALQSNLEKNEELKSALLEEIPWVLEDKNETEQKHHIALLFDSYKLGQDQEATLSKLQEMILAEGAFPWFKGMGPDRYITQYIATGIARLEHLGIKNERAQQIRMQVTAWLSRQIEADYRRIPEEKKLSGKKGNTEEQHIGYLQIQYLYLLSFNPDFRGNEETRQAISFYKKQAATYWPKFNAYMKGMIALSLDRLGDPKPALEIMQSLRETAIHKEDLGMYWMQPGGGYWWHEAPIEAQSLLIESFREVSADTASVDEMKRWLLKQKQTQNWRTTKATADACYALLLTGSQWLTQSPDVTITLGDKTVGSKDQHIGAGTGYFKVHYNANGVKPAMGDIRVNISPVPGGAGASWGAVYWQYFENLDKITSAATPLSLQRQLYIERNTDRGPALEEIKDQNQLRVGDRVKIRIVLQADRDMEYVHLKDQRGACFEPVNVISGYRWQEGLGYYESTRDASSNFFISYLRKGTYVFEYPVNVMAKGDFSNGIATIQCMYAPEFSSHSEGGRVKVE